MTRRSCRTRRKCEKMKKTPRAMLIRNAEGREEQPDPPAPSQRKPAEQPSPTPGHGQQKQGRGPTEARDRAGRTARDQRPQKTKVTQKVKIKMVSVRGCLEVMARCLMERWRYLVSGCSW